MHFRFGRLGVTRAGPSVRPKCVVFNYLGSAEKTAGRMQQVFYFWQIWEMGSKGIYGTGATDLVPHLRCRPGNSLDPCLS